MRMILPAAVPDVQTRLRAVRRSLALASGWGLLFAQMSQGATAVRLFEDDFNRGIPGWTAVQPSGTYLDGPMRWQYDIVSGAFVEQSNIYTDAAAASPSATAVMLINDTTSGAAFTYRARLTAGDDDAFGLIFGYSNPTNFYRVTFTRQNRADPGYPWNGWNVDRKVNNVATNLFGDGTPDHVPSFINTQYQPFDVTITVSDANALTLVVVDDPEGAQIEYRLVESQPLPGPANGKVGLTVWGMSGTALRGFRASQLELTPNALSGNPDALTAWTPVVTQRGDGSGLDPGSGNGGVGIWSLALGPNGAYGTLHENSDSFGGNDAEGVLDFAAASIVAGEATWQDYLMTARILPADDDGHGILVRYQDEQNFYRVALRSQASATGPAKGLSVQKVVGGIWEEVFREETAKYDPVANVPYEITAAMLGNRLQVQLIADPDGSAQVFSYGPFELTGDTLATGKIGFFSWGMSRTEFDWVRVEGIDGLPLVVASPFGAPNPPVGLNGFAPGTTIEASVPSPIEEVPGVRRTVTGWTGQGSVLPSGTGSSVTFTLNEISSLTWHWQTEIRLQVSAGPGGQVTGPAVEWLPEGTNVTLTAQPSPGYVFTGWAGDVASTQGSLTLALVRPFTVAAAFDADSDGDGLPDSWELAKLGGVSGGPDDDADGDGDSNRVEYERGSDPGEAEVLVAESIPAPRWENTQRDPVLPGQLVVRDFGMGFRGPWENSNDYREAVDGRSIGVDNVVPGVSFEGPRILIVSNVWNQAWRDFTASAVFSVGDNDGNCVYFRYRDENNWYRVTVCGENNNLDWRAPFGVTIQKRVNGVFSLMAEDASIATDPTDTSFYKRIRVTVNAQGSNFEVRVTGWNTFVEPADWDTGTEAVLAFSDTDHVEGRFGVGTWGQSGGATATASNPVAAGVLIEDVAVSVAGQEVFREDWEQVPLSDQLPAGWEAVSGLPVGAWQMTAHGTILQTANAFTSSTATIVQPRADGEGPILLSPAPGTANYLLELGFHPFDDDGIGFVYDFRDTNNFSRVMFVSEGSGAGRIPQGVNVSRKSGGVWSDLLVGDASFVYANGSPFLVEFANDNGAYRMTARMADDPLASQTWSWTAPRAAEGNRYGLTCWGETDAHFLPIRAYRLKAIGGGGELRIASVSVSGGNLVLDIVNPDGTPYEVEQSATLRLDSWSPATGQLNGTQWITPLAASPGGVFYRLRR